MKINDKLRIEVPISTKRPLSHLFTQKDRETHPESIYFLIFLSLILETIIIFV